MIIKKIHILYLFRGGVLIYAVHCTCCTDYFVMHFFQDHLVNRKLLKVKNEIEIFRNIINLFRVVKIYIKHYFLWIFSQYLPCLFFH